MSCCTLSPLSPCWWVGTGCEGTLDSLLPRAPSVMSMVAASLTISSGDSSESDKGGEEVIVSPSCLTMACTASSLVSCITAELLDSRLAELVGRKVLAHPKYALTIIHGYARANKLYYQKTIKCDELLYNIFERENIELGTLWKEICRKIKKVERGVVSVSHKMSTLEKYSSSVMAVSVDNDYNIYPENWKLEISRGSKSFLKTQSFLSNVTNSKDKRKSFKRNKSFEL